jgi:hypothetical protein
MHSANLAPIALFVYNRPDHLARVSAALARNPEAARSQLFVFVDAPKAESAAPKVAEVRSLAAQLRGFASVEVFPQSSNQGIARSIIEGATSLTGEYGRVIVLEDDLLPGVHFLRYMNEALLRYADDDRVISIHAYSYPVRAKLPETFFLRGADCWGWATWKRAWDLFEPDGRKLLAELDRRRLTADFDFEDSYPYTQMLRDCIDGRNDSWAIRWYASAYLNGKLTLYPGSSQVQNIGADGSGMHVGSTRLFEHAVWGRSLELDAIPVEESRQARHAFAAYLADLQPSVAARVLRRFKRLVSAP